MKLSKYAGNAKKILRVSEDGEHTEIYDSVQEAAACNGVTVETIRRWSRDKKAHYGHTYHYRRPEKEFRLPQREVIGIESFRRPPYSGTNIAQKGK